MSGHQRLAEPGDCLSHPHPLGLELDVALLELCGHVVERATQLGELVVAGHLDALREPALRDSLGGVPQPSQGADDRAPEQIGHRREEHE